MYYTLILFHIELDDGISSIGGIDSICGGFYSIEVKRSFQYLDQYRWLTFD